MGSWSYDYDVLGRVNIQVDAKSQTSILSYDVLGRLQTRIEKDAGGIERQYTAWTYGTSRRQSQYVDQLIEAKACTNSGCGAVLSDKQTTYDDKGRPTQDLACGNGSVVGSYTEAYYPSSDHQNNGRLQSVTYPSGFAVAYSYTNFAYLTQVKGATSGYVYWQANTVDAEGHVTQDKMADSANLVTEPRLRSFDRAHDGRDRPGSAVDPPLPISASPMTFSAI